MEHTPLLLIMMLGLGSMFNVALGSDQSGTIASVSPQETLTLEDSPAKLIANIKYLKQQLAIRGKTINQFKQFALLKNSDGSSSLHHAAEMGNVDIVQMLIVDGVPVNAKNNDGNTPLMNAAWAGHAAGLEHAMRNF